MAKLTLTNVGIWAGGIDVAGTFNSVSMELSADLQESTTFADGDWRRRADSNLKNSMLSFEGYYEEDLDGVLFDALGDPRIVAITPDGHTPGDLAYILHQTVGAYSVSGSVGEMLAVTWATEGNGQPFPVDTMLVQQGITSTEIAAGTVELGAGNRVAVGSLTVDDTLQLWAFTHVTSPITGQIQLTVSPAADNVGAARTALISQTWTPSTGVATFELTGQLVTTTLWDIQLLNSTTPMTAGQFDVAFFARIVS